MNVRYILGIVAASSVLVTAVNAKTPISAKKHPVHFLAPAAHQKVNDPVWYQPPRSPGFNDLTES